jgi:hypothetical protein
MTTMTTLRTSIFAVALLACGGRAAPPPDAPAGFDAGPDAAGFDASPDAGAMDRPDAARREAGPLPDASRDRGDADEPPDEDVDGNTTWDEGPMLRPGEPAVAGRVVSFGDRDYVRIPATRGQYLAILLKLPPSCAGSFGEGCTPPGAGVFDPERRPLADFIESSDCEGSFAEEFADSEALFRAPENGTYYVELGPNFVPPPHDWVVEVVDLATSANTLVVEESGASAITAAHRCVIGAFETADDVDELSFDAAAPRLVEVLPPGFHASTGSARSIEVRLGSAVLARSASDTSRRVWTDASPGAFLRVAPPISRGTNDHYLLRISPLSFSADPIFFFRTPFAEIRQREADDARNDEASGAELVRLGCVRSDIGVVCPAYSAGDTADYCRCTSEAECGGAEFTCAAPPPETPGSGNTCRTTSTPSSCLGSLGTRPSREAPNVLTLSLPPGDVDHFAIDVDGNVYTGRGSLYIECGGATFGSSVRDLEFSVFDQDGSPLLTVYETAATGTARLSLGGPDRPLSDGRYVLRVRAGRHEAGLDGHFVACAITSGPPLYGP